MSAPVPFSLNLNLELYQLEEFHRAREVAEAEGTVFYCWKTTGIHNWLERGVSISDVLGLVLLPPGLPDQIEMLDDPPDWL